MADTADGKSVLGDAWDRTFRSLNARADVTQTKPATVQTVHPVLELTETFIVQTARVRDRGDGSSGDVIFILSIGRGGAMRVVLPPEVADVIVRQRDALTGKNRRLAARHQAQLRKAAGIEPAFLKGKKRPNKSKKPKE